jgi:hypothetical protein
VAEFNGVRVITIGQTLRLVNRWKALGANVNTGRYSVAKSFSWTLDSVQQATTADLSIIPIAGKHSLGYSYKDFIGRSYSFSGQVEVLSASQFKQRMASQAAITGAAL